MLITLYILSGLIIFQLILPFITVFLSRWTSGPVLPENGNAVADYACIITAYKNAAIAAPLVQSLIRQSYPHFHIYLVADECPPVTIPAHPSLTVLEPSGPLRLKARSIIYAMEHLVRPHQYIVIFDADNLAHPDFLKETDRYVTAGFTCIQGERTAKNTDNNFAAADSLGEHYKNYIERYAPFVLGSSSVISGSGMATETSLYSDYLNSPAIQEGQYLGKKMLQEDKILQNFILNQGGRIAFAKSAVCYDEKVQSAAAVETQRSRWLFSYFQNLPNTFGHFFRGVFSLNWNRFFFGLITLPLPMFLQVGVAGLIFILGLFLDIRVSMAIAVTMLIFAGTVLLSLSYSGVPGLVAKALTALPSFIWRQARALLKMRNPQKNFQHTEHSKVVTLDDVIKEDKP